MSSAQIAIVVIGRNEARRLPLCLGSLPPDLPVCYVDSGSHDASLDIALQHGAKTLRLTDDLPFSAARARNEGFAWFRENLPQLQAVFFIDGDCVMGSEFLKSATRILESNDDCAIVVGQVQEINRKGSIYGMLADLEWSKRGAKEITNFNELGGIMLVRASDFIRVGGFDARFIAGEDSELGIRLHLSGRKVLLIDQVMASHHMEMQRFGQWWRRSIRAGHALAQRYAKHGQSPLGDSKSAVRSTIVYGIAIPSLVLAGAVSIGVTGMAPLAAYAYLWWRFFGFYRQKGADLYPASVGATFGVIAKFANALGLLRFHLQKARGQFSLIEYK